MVSAILSRLALCSFGERKNKSRGGGCVLGTIARTKHDLRKDLQCSGMRKKIQFKIVMMIKVMSGAKKAAMDMGWKGGAIVSRCRDGERKKGRSIRILTSKSA